MTTLTTSPATEGPPESRDYPITAEQFFTMVEAGVFPQKSRVFLWDGRLYEKMAKTNAHATCGAIFNRALMRRLPDEWNVWHESPLAVDRQSVPLPDLMVVRGADLRAFLKRDQFLDPSLIGLVIEIAVTSLAKDLGGRLERYARALIPAYWVVDVPGMRILAHAAPRFVEGRGEYTQVETIGRGQSLPLVLDGREVDRIPFEELLGP